MPALGYWGAWMEEELRILGDKDVDLVGVPAQLGENLGLGNLYAAAVPFDGGNLAVGVDGDGAIVDNVELPTGLAVDKGAKQQLVSALTNMHLDGNCGEAVLLIVLLQDSAASGFGGVPEDGANRSRERGVRGACSLRVSLSL
ncbi:hypothetical protein NLG97_g11353 [Lecanicillium saksenae]|uniref:Uncharacterized protein n=1 Tax=Lecanicillium saksenae TaxID=468837 RepID=A0ACC1QCF7_9HYPO|nr:hypothetical protein NLG97_g11353 [Lecanicillium saksenae]